MQKKRDRGDYFKERRARLAAERAALEPPKGKALTETVLVRVSGDMLVAIDQARRAGLFEISRSEFIRGVIAEKLR